MDAVIFVVPGGRNRAVCNRSRRPMDVVASDPFAQEKTRRLGPEDGVSFKRAIRPSSSATVQSELACQTDKTGFNKDTTRR